MGIKKLIVYCIPVGILVGFLLTSTALAQPLHRKGCSFPMERVEVCWEATGPQGGEYGPFPEVHMLPVAQERDGQAEVLRDYTRTIFRQLLPGNLAGELITEWAASLDLTETMQLAAYNGWPATLWIHPRRLRNSSSNGSGLVDLDIYIFKYKKLLRTLRIRVESKPDLGGDGFERGVAMGAFLAGSGAVGNIPGLASVGAVAGSAAMGSPGAPKAGYSLEMMTELAMRKLLYITQFSLEELPGIRLADNRPFSPERVKNSVSSWWTRAFTPK